MYNDVYYNPTQGADVPNTLYSLGAMPSYPVAYNPNSVQAAPVGYQQNVPNYEYPASQSEYAQSPFVPLAYAPLPNQPQYSNDPEIEALLQFTYNNYKHYQQTLETGQRPEEAPCVC